MFSVERFIKVAVVGVFVASVAPRAHADSPSHPLAQKLNPIYSEAFPKAGEPPVSVFFGMGMAIQGNTAAIGEPGAQPSRVAVFTRADSTAPWKRTSTWYAAKADNDNGLGKHIASGPNVTLVASDTSVYVFWKESDGWHRIQRILAPTVDALTSFPDAIDFDGGTAVLTGHNDSGGIAYIYEQQPNGKFTFKAKLRSWSAVPNDGFGSSVAIHGGTVVVGAPGASTGSAFVFKRVGTVWTHAQQLLPIDGHEGDAFGSSIAIDGSTVAVGAPRALAEGETGATQIGAAYVFSLLGGAYVERDALHPTSSEHPNYFQYGRAVKLTRDRLVVWAHENDPIPMAGNESLVFTYVRTGSNTQPFGIARRVRNAWNVATDGNQVFVASDNGRCQYCVGSAYVYDIRVTE